MSKDASTDEPKTADEVLALHKLLRVNPQAYMNIVNRWIQNNPTNANAYYERHIGWMTIGEPRKALDDLNRVISLDPDQSAFHARGDVYRHLGDHDSAIEDFKRGEALDPAKWQGMALTLLAEADSHARLGDEESALACCARLPEDFWTPGVGGAPAGDKAEIADALHRLAAEARAWRH